MLGKKRFSVMQQGVIGYIRDLICVIVVIFLAVSNVYSASAFPHKILTIISPQDADATKKTSPLKFELREVGNGLKVSIRLSDIPKKNLPEPPSGIKIGGDYIIFLDEICVINEPYQGASLDISRDVPLITLRTGKHTLRCEVRSISGEVFKHDIQFMFDGSPTISVTETAVDKSGMLDPAVTINFVGDNNGAAGFIDVFVDEHPFINVPIKKDATGKKMPLSQITGKPLPTAGLLPGTHLLLLRATGINGNTTVSYTSFKVNTAPELSIIKDKNGNFQKAVATFLKSSQGYSGSVEVFCDQNILLAKREEGTSISVKLEEIVEGLERINYQHTTTPVSIVFSLRAANSTENWQVVTIRR